MTRKLGRKIQCNLVFWSLHPSQEKKKPLVKGVLVPPKLLIPIIRYPPIQPPTHLSRPHNLSRPQHQRRLLLRRGVDSCAQHLGLLDRGFVVVRLGTFARNLSLE